MTRRILASLLIAAAYALSLNAQSVITLNEESDGRYTVDASVNGVGVRTFYTAESWFASMSTTTYLFLYENGYIADADVRGITALKMPDGSSTKAASFVIRNLKIGNVIVQNLPAFVVKKQTVPLLIGNSAFDCFGEVTQEGHRLIINDAEDLGTPVAEAVDPLDSLKAAAQAHLDAKEYNEAASCLDILYRNGELSMLNEYQYAVILNILEKDDENIAVSEKWLGDNEGKSLTMDYWVYDGLGDTYTRKKETDKAIECYEKAVAAYCKLFNTTEKEIKKSNFQDETLGYTLYDLGRLHASKRNLNKAEYYCALAAKCGNAAAKEFCDTYKVKY